MRAVPVRTGIIVSTVFTVSTVFNDSARHDGDLGSCEAPLFLRCTDRFSPFLEDRSRPTHDVASWRRGVENRQAMKRRLPACEADRSKPTDPSLPHDGQEVLARLLCCVPSSAELRIVPNKAMKSGILEVWFCEA